MIVNVIITGLMLIVGICICISTYEVGKHCSFMYIDDLSKLTDEEIKKYYIKVYKMYKYFKKEAKVLSFLGKTTGGTFLVYKDLSGRMELLYKEIEKRNLIPELKRK